VNRVIVYAATAVNADLESRPAGRPAGDRSSAPKAPLPRSSHVLDLDDPLVAALGDRLLAAWLGENSSKLRLPLLTSCSEQGNTPAEKGGTSEKTA